VACDEPRGQHIRWHETRAGPRGPDRHHAHASVRRRRVQPDRQAGSPDYGLLCTSGSDPGFSNGGGPNAGNPGQTQRLDTLISAILRIDPRSPSVSGGTKGLGDYTIPSINKFAADGNPKTFGEIYAYGFRNAHRLSWDLTDGTMFASDIGMNNIEEINIVHEGGNYGWMKREGIFENGITRPGGALDQLFALPAEVLNGSVRRRVHVSGRDDDHNDGQAVTGGFAYYGRIAALRGKFVFGDIVRGRLFVSDVAAMKRQTTAFRRPWRRSKKSSSPCAARAVSAPRDVPRADRSDQRRDRRRADLHISRSGDGELFMTSRQDGMIRMLVPDSDGPG
jgi:hypothetical protein